MSQSKNRARGLKLLLPGRMPLSSSFPSLVCLWWSHEGNREPREPPPSSRPCYLLGREQYALRGDIYRALHPLMLPTCAPSDHRAASLVAIRTGCMDQTTLPSPRPLPFSPQRE